VTPYLDGAEQQNHREQGQQHAIRHDSEELGTAEAANNGAWSKRNHPGTGARAAKMTTDVVPVVGVILAGGLARRLGGGDKPMRQIGGRTILSRVIERLAPQCDELILNANGDPQRFASFGLSVIPDTVENFPGPLAGVLAALDWTAGNRRDMAWVASIPGDCPFLPRDLIQRLQEARMDQNAQLAVAASGDQAHPVIGLWSVALRHELRHALVAEDMRKIDRWTARYRLAKVTWPLDPVDPFFNANTPDDMAEAEALALQLGD
jgi:molybdopterin-guanine dinucleotide biosynthesis protein A